MLMQGHVPFYKSSSESESSSKDFYKKKQILFRKREFHNTKIDSAKDRRTSFREFSYVYGIF